MGKLHICLFGRVRVSRGEDQPEVKLSPTEQTLLAYLLLQPGRFHPRSVLTDLSWGDRPETQARGCLNTTLWRLRRALEPDAGERGAYLVKTPAGEVGFNWKSDHWLDLTTFECSANGILALPTAAMKREDAQQLEQILPLYGGELLEGFYDDWALRERERLRASYLNCITRLILFYGGQGDYERGLHFGHLILSLDPLREDIHREVMRLYVASGQRAMAVRQYEICRKVLAEELGIPPMEETQMLFAAIGGTTAPAVPGAVGRREPALLGQALEQLTAAIRSFQATHDQLERATRLVERLTQDPAFSS